MGIKIVLLVVFFAVMVGVGIYSRKHASSVDGFVLGSRSVGLVADSVCLWNVLFFRSRICRVCRTVRVEIWNRLYMDRNRKCTHRKSACVGSAGPQNQSYDTASEVQDNAGFFWRKV